MIGLLYHSYREIAIKFCLIFREKGIVPVSAQPSSDPPDSRLPLTRAAGRSSDHRYQNPLAVNFLEIQKLLTPPGLDNELGVGEWAVPGIPAEVSAPAPGAGSSGVVLPDPAYGGGCMSRRIGEYSGYTSAHLPISMDRPPCPKNPEAIRAILAARMAFSSFSTFRLLKYGFSARSSAC